MMDMLVVALLFLSGSLRRENDERQEGLLSDKDVAKRIKALMPRLGLGGWLFVDRTYQPLSSDIAREIWEDTSLEYYEYRNGGLHNESFDCDDFSFVYKGAVSEYVYDNSITNPYAAGIVFGQPKTGHGTGHVANIFVDTNDTVRVLESITGEIVDGSDWEYVPYFVLI